VSTTGRFLVDGPPTDADWWREHSHSSSFFATENGGIEVLSKEQKEQRSGGTPTKRVFQNRGLDTWEKTRMAWSHSSACARPDSQPSIAAVQEELAYSKAQNSKLSKPLSRYRKRELMKNLTSQRQFALPKQMGLAELVGVYNDIWNEDGSE